MSQERARNEPETIGDGKLVLDDVAFGVTWMWVVPLVGREPSHDKERETDQDVGRHDVQPNLHRQGIHKGKEPRRLARRDLTGIKNATVRHCSSSSSFSKERGFFSFFFFCLSLNDGNRRWCGKAHVFPLRELSLSKPVTRSSSSVTHSRTKQREQKKNSHSYVNIEDGNIPLVDKEYDGTPNKGQRKEEKKGKVSTRKRMT